MSNCPKKHSRSKNGDFSKLLLHPLLWKSLTHLCKISINVLSTLYSPAEKKYALQQRLLTKYSWPIQKTHVNSELLYFMLKMAQPTAQHLISSSPPTPNPHYEQGTRPYFSLHWKNGTIYSSRVEGCNTFFDFWKPTQFCRSRISLGV